MRIADILGIKGREVIKTSPTADVVTAAEVLSHHRIGALLVEDQWMKLIGVFTERNLVNAIARYGSDALGFKVQQVMSMPVISCAPTDRIDAVMATMTLKRVRHLPVIDAGKLVGIVSMGDLVKHRLDEKELEANVLLEISRMRA
jgi:CBS domain-containing protein